MISSDDGADEAGSFLGVFVFDTGVLSEAVGGISEDCFSMGAVAWFDSGRFLVGARAFSGSDLLPSSSFVLLDWSGCMSDSRESEAGSASRSRSVSTRGFWISKESGAVMMGSSRSTGLVCGRLSSCGGPLMYGDSTFVVGSSHPRYQ